MPINHLPPFVRDDAREQVRGRRLQAQGLLYASDGEGQVGARLLVRDGRAEVACVFCCGDFGLRAGEGAGVEGEVAEGGSEGCAGGL